MYNGPVRWNEETNTPITKRLRNCKYSFINFINIQIVVKNWKLKKKKLWLVYWIYFQISRCLPTPKNRWYSAWRWYEYKWWLSRGTFSGLLFYWDCFGYTFHERIQMISSGREMKHRFVSNHIWWTLSKSVHRELNLRYFEGSDERTPLTVSGAAHIWNRWHNEMCAWLFLCNSQISSNNVFISFTCFGKVLLMFFFLATMYRSSSFAFFLELVCRLKWYRVC